MSKEKDKSLESWIWDAACSIRGAKDAPKYKDYILPLIYTFFLANVEAPIRNRKLLAFQVGVSAKMPVFKQFLVTSLAFFALAACAERPVDGMPPNLAIQPVEQDANWAREWWRARHEERIEQAKISDIDLLMLGDSITQGWEGPGAEVWRQYYQDRNAFNLGFGGDRTEHVLWRLRHGAVDDMQPKLVVLLIGTNNTAYRMDPAFYTVEGIRMIIAELRERLPQSKILLLAIFPHHSSPYNDMRERNEEINQLVASLDDGTAVHYLNVNHAFLDKGGILRFDLMSDLLHPNTAGYAAWAEAMEPTLSKLLR